MDIRPTLVYDGDCAFCSSTVRVLQRWVPGSSRMVPWQRADLAALGLSEEQCDAAVQFVGPKGTYAGAAAFAAHLRTSHPVLRLVGRAIGSRAGLLLAEPAYRWVSANRHRLPGGTPACNLPEA